MTPAFPKNAKNTKNAFLKSARAKPAAEQGDLSYSVSRDLAVFSVFGPRFWSKKCKKRVFWTSQKNDIKNKNRVFSLLKTHYPLFFVFFSVKRSLTKKGTFFLRVFHF
jgi:hypothetical protein